MRRSLFTLTFSLSIALSLHAVSGSPSHKAITPARSTVLHHVAGGDYFVNAKGDAVLLRGDDTWTDNALNGTFSFPDYLDLLTAQGSNYLRMWAPDAPTYSGKLAPFERTADGKWDLNKYNHVYFDLLKGQVRSAATRGIYVSVQLFFDYDPGGRYHIWAADYWNGSNNGNGTTTDDIAVENGSSAATLALQKAYVVKVLDTLGSEPNVLFEIANEPHNDQATMHWEDLLTSFMHQYQQRHGLLAQPVGITSSYPELDQQDINRRIAQTSADWTAPSGAHYMSNPPDATGRIPVIVDSDHTFGVGGDATWVWKQVTRGYSVNIMDTMQGTKLTGLMQMNIKPAAASQVASSRLALREISQVVQLVRVGTMKPQDKLSSTDYVLADPGRGEYVVLAPKGGMFTVDLSGAPGMLREHWIDVATGSIAGGDMVRAGALRTVTAPTSPAVLVLTPH